MRSPLQEKFQIVTPTKPEDGEPWVSFESQRSPQDRVPRFCPESATDEGSDKFNKMPPGMEIDNQDMKYARKYDFVMSGESDVSKDTNPQAFDEGFKKRELKATDDQYTGEHVDHFYGDAGGFAERNNYLDRM
jgi:hypothetical protein